MDYVLQMVLETSIGLRTGMQCQCAGIGGSVDHVYRHWVGCTCSLVKAGR